MKILLISPCQDATHRTPGALQIPQIALQLVAGLTDPKHEIRIVEEEFVDLDMSLSPDVVGLSLMTANAPRGYALADHFRAKGAKVVLGGIHPSVLPEEAAAHADAVVVGEAEEVWPQVVADLEAGRPKPVYRAGPADLTNVPFPRRELGRVKRWLNVIPVMTTRGCPYNCEFCSVSRIYGRKIRSFPVDWVVEDIKRAGGKVHLILDDNVIGRPAYAEELFKALKPLNIYWVGQASMSFALREDLMRLAYASGCRALFFGMETVSEESMKRMKKSFRDLQDVADGIRRIQAAGIRFHASVVFGFDSDDTRIFRRTVDFLMTCRVHSVTFNILTPYPGTRVYDTLKGEGRLFTEDWRHYNHMTVVFRPARMTALELAEGQLYARRTFFRWPSILRRFATHWRHPVLYAGMNLAYRHSARHAHTPVAPGWDKQA
ncbi:MAG: B12-binding domain-containing radical SAM protein [Kiritimatiellae bacterium]|nr:B12-binding domain-containing radical SAM protein [Kiritimatiellia bacterium]